MTRAVIDQHEFIERLLRATGGVPVEAAIPPDYAGKRADILFEAEGLIAEIKSLTSDRRNDPDVMSKLGEVFVQNANLGGPIPFGEVTVRLHNLPPLLAERSLRVVGKRVRAEVASAARQIQATRDVLKLPYAYGLLVFVSPPERIGHATMGWLINDVVSQSEDRRGLDGALVIETSFGLGAESARASNSFSVFSSISGRPLPDDFIDRVSQAWERITGQPARPAESEQFTMLGATE